MFNTPIVDVAPAPRKGTKSTRSSKKAKREAQNEPATYATQGSSSATNLTGVCGSSAAVAFPSLSLALDTTAVDAHITIPIAPVAGATLAGSNATGAGAAHFGADTESPHSSQSMHPHENAALLGSQVDLRACRSMPPGEQLRRAALDNIRATTPIAASESESALFMHPRTRTASDAHILNSQVESTPHGHSARNGTLASDRAPEIEKQLLRELHPIALTNLDHVLGLYEDVATTAKIDKFLDSPGSPFKRSRPGVEKGRWNRIPKAPTREEQIYSPLKDVLVAITKALINGTATTTEGVSVVREIVDTHDSSLLHDNKLKSRPDYVVRAEGPSFEIPRLDSQRFEGHETLGYTNAASVFEVKLDKYKGTETQQVGQLARYCE